MPLKQRLKRLDTLLSTGNADSEIVKLNEQKSATLSEDGGYLVKRALELNKETDGAFDIAIYPVMEAWGFPIQNFRVPSADELTGLLKHVDARRSHTIRIREKSLLKMTR